MHIRAGTREKGGSEISTEAIYVCVCHVFTVTQNLLNLEATIVYQTRHVLGHNLRLSSSSETRPS